jgi:tetratricopeptide (TPR) repeat protein
LAAEKERALAEIAQAYSYHSMLHNEESGTSSEDDFSDADDEEESSGDEDEDGGEDNSEGEASEPEEPTIPLTRVRFQDDLTLPKFGPYSPYGRGGACSNTLLRDGLWLRDPKLGLMGSNMGFLSQLAQLCIQAKVRDCTKKDCLAKKKAMDLAAPKCKWSKFRNWALVSMSCQAAMSREQKLSKAHTHLAKAASGCSIILKECVKAKVRKACFLPFLDESIDMPVDLAGVSNVIYWMAKIQAEIGIGPKNFGTWGHRFLPAKVSLPAIEDASTKAQKLDVCQNRLWNLVNVSDRKQSDLPDIIEAIEPHAPSLSHKNHQDCTPSKCQWAHANSETVVQLHKCEVTQETDCKKEQMIFPVDLLETALELGKSTAWLCNTVRLSMPSDPYIAISHVWSDGTGVGAKNPGSVNRCLFEFFAGIATRLDCKAVWWDALSIPQEATARSKALNKMHYNYANAKCTLVHDSFLLDFEWKDDGSPCIALVLSTWFTRGWTALELFMSNKVQVLFKDPKGGAPLIKDLDDDILAPGPAAASRAYWLATSLIKRLRRPIDNVGDLLVILTPRSTSWVRDRTVIAGLLAGVPNCDFKKGESIIARQILQYLGKIPYACLLHGKPTMCDFEGFSWCPAVLDDMPVDLSLDMQGGAGAKKEALLEIDETGLVEGYWWCRRLDRLEVDKKKIKPFGDNLAATVKINNSLRHWKHCLLLRHSLDQNDLALLVVPFGVDGADCLLKCRYVGAVAEDCEESTLKIDHDDFAWEEWLVQIGGKDNGKGKMRARKALEIMDNLYYASESDDESDHSNIPEIYWVQSSDEEVADPTPASDDKAWYRSDTALDYHRLDAMDNIEPASNLGRPDPHHLFIAVKRDRKDTVQYLIKHRVDLTAAQKNSLVEDLGSDDETTFDRIKMLGDVYADNNMLSKAIGMYKIAIAGYESLGPLKVPLDYHKAQYALGSVCVKVGKQKQAKKELKGPESLSIEAKNLFNEVLNKCDEKTVRKQTKKINKSAQSKDAGQAGPASTGGTANRPDQRANDGKDNEHTSTTKKKSATQGNQAKSTDQGSGDLADDWYRLELNTIADLTLLYADEHQFDKAAETYSKALTKFGTAPLEVEAFTGQWEFRLSQPYEDKKTRDDEASGVYERALRRFDSVFRKTHVLNMITALNLGINYSLRAKLQQAEDLLRRALEGFKKLLDSAGRETTGVEHMVMLLTFRHLGILLTEQHKFDEAQELLEKALDGFSLKLGLEDSSTLAVLCDLARNYLARRPPQYDEAEKLYQKAATGFERNRIRSNHRLAFRAALGLTRVQARKDIVNASKSCKEVIRRLQQRTEARNLDVCDGQLFLGRLYEEQGDLENAEATLRKCLEGFKYLDGPNSIKYLQAAKRLGCLYDKQKNSDGAETILKEALKGFETVLGAFHNSTLTIAQDLGSLHLRQKKLKEAEALCNRAFKGFEKVAGQDSRPTAEAAHALGTVYLEQGKFSQAKEMYAKAFLVYQKVLKDKNDPLILQAAIDWGKVCAAIGDKENNETAAKMYQRAVDGFTKTNGAGDPLTLDAQLKLGEVCRQQGKFQIAETKIQGALDGFQLNLTQGHPKIFEAKLRLGHLRFDQKNADEDDDQGSKEADEAEDLIKEARDSLVGSLGPDDPLSLEASALLGELYLDNDEDADEGETLLKGVLDGYCEQLTPGHPKTIRTMDSLIDHYKTKGRSRYAKEMLKRKREALEKGHGADYAVMIMDMTDRRRGKRDQYDMWSDDDSDWNTDEDEDEDEGEDSSESRTSGGDSEEEDINVNADQRESRPYAINQYASVSMMPRNLPIRTNKGSSQFAVEKLEVEEEDSGSAPSLAYQKVMPEFTRGQHAQLKHLLRLEALMNSTWRGQYYYQDGSTGGEFTFFLRCERTEDKLLIAGSGADTVGAFTIDGNVVATGEITFLKEYGGFRWTYSGRVDEGTGVMSGWWDRGAFTFSRVEVDQVAGDYAHASESNTAALGVSIPNNNETPNPLSPKTDVHKKLPPAFLLDRLPAFSKTLFYAKGARSLSFETIAQALNESEVAVTALFYGHAKVSSESAKKLALCLGVSEQKLFKQLVGYLVDV